jgi:hypothetical protein
MPLRWCFDLPRKHSGQLHHEMPQGFVHARAVFFRRDVAAGVVHGFFHFRDCICRASRKRRVTAIQHRDVVVVIARGEDLFTGDFQQARQFGEGGALVIIGVTKTQIDSVPLVIEFRLLGAGLVDEARDEIHLFLAFGDQAGWAVAFVDDASFCFLIHEINHLREHRRGGIEKFGVIPSAACVPISIRFPCASIFCRPKNIALAGENEIGAKREGEIGETGLQKIDRTARVDGPDCAIILKVFNRLHASAIEHRITAVGDEGAIEVSAKETDLGEHERANLGIAFANAIRLRLAKADRRAKVNGNRMKSAYELAMERLEKKTPSVALTSEQKQQIAEIESTYKARIAEKELFLKGEMEKARVSGKYEELESLEKQFGVELRRLQEDCEAKKEKLRASFTK